MSEASMLKEFLELIQIPVQSRDERKIADVVKQKLLDLGLTVEEDKAGEKLGGNTGNLIGRLAGASEVPSILLSAHLDRVRNSGAIHPVVNEAEDLIKSDGTSILAADDVSGLCAVLDGLRRVKESGKPHGPVEVVFSVCEEIGVQGSGQLDFSKLKSKRRPSARSRSRFTASRPMPVMSQRRDSLPSVLLQTRLCIFRKAVSRPR